MTRLAAAAAAWFAGVDSRRRVVICACDARGPSTDVLALARLGWSFTWDGRGGARRIFRCPDCSLQGGSP